MDVILTVLRCLVAYYTVGILILITSVLFARRVFSDLFLSEIIVVVGVILTAWPFVGLWITTHNIKQ